MRHRRGWILAAIAVLALLAPRPDRGCARADAADSPIKSNQSLSLEETPENHDVSDGQVDATANPQAAQDAVPTESARGGVARDAERPEAPAGDTAADRRITRGVTESDVTAGAGRVSAAREPGRSGGLLSQLGGLWPLVLVLVLIGGGVLLVRRLSPGARSQASGVLRIVARTIVSPKQHLILIELGRRYILAGVSSDRIEPLCVIHGEEEVGELVGLLRAGAGQREFEKLLAQESGAFGEPVEEPVRRGDSADALGRAGKELSNLLGKIRRMQGAKP